MLQDNAESCICLSGFHSPEKSILLSYNWNRKKIYIYNICNLMSLVIDNGVLSPNLCHRPTYHL